MPAHSVGCGRSAPGQQQPPVDFRRRRRRRGATGPSITSRHHPGVGVGFEAWVRSHSCSSLVAHDLHLAQPAGQGWKLQRTDLLASGQGCVAPCHHLALVASADTGRRPGSARCRRRQEKQIALLERPSWLRRFLKELWNSPPSRAKAGLQGGALLHPSRREGFDQGDRITGSRRRFRQRCLVAGRA